MWAIGFPLRPNPPAQCESKWRHLVKVPQEIYSSSKTLLPFESQGSKEVVYCYGEIIRYGEPVRFNKHDHSPFNNDV